MTTVRFSGGTIVLEDRLLPRGEVDVTGDRITAVRPTPSATTAAAERVVDLRGGYLVPGYVDLPVHRDGRPGAARGRGVRPRLPRPRRPLQRRPLVRHLRADGGRARLGRAARRSPLLRHVRPRPAAPESNLPDARRRPGGDPVL